ncbi:MAG: ski2-like helicase [bacterium ADurb.Bin429]|nr:MAG: ski2-like helicase [bacterium ADurb.Bin429]
MDFTAFLNDIRHSSDYRDQIVYIHEVAASDARHAELSLTEPLLRMLAARGIGQLYSHQVLAISAAREGADVLVATGTASGKSLCFQIPILERLLSEPTATALLLFPTKALSQDQFQGLRAALDAATLPEVLAGVYDGDTPSSTRRKLRDGANLILTNPDMLHAGILPRHARWASFLSRLRLVVLDELHVYSGIFGSNMANVLRRLARLCAHYGSRLQYLACSATVGNPRELARALTGREVTLVDDDGSPHGKRTYVFWNPPRERARTWRGRRSANVEAHELMALLITKGVRTITFSKAKMTAEIIHRYVSERLQQTAPHLLSALSPYRGGYLPEERREIERKLFSGELLGVSSTKALELGINIGGLDASILVGYPGTLAGFFQQAGRAGRATDDALVVLVGLDTPVNQYVMSHPEYLFDRPVEEAALDADNPFVVTGHLRCAAHELALPDAEVARFGPHALTALEVLEKNLKVRRIDGRWYHAASELPQTEVSLRSYSDANVVIEDVDGGAIIGELDKFDASPLLYPGAIYLHAGDTWLVLTLDLERNIARVKRVEVDYYTQPLGGTDIHHIDRCLREKPFGTGRAHWGEVTAVFHNWGYEKVRFYELDAISRHAVDLPTFLLETMAVWIVPSEALMERVRAAGLDAFNGLRGVGYAARMLLPLFITCDTLDFSHTVGSINSPWNALFIYERYPRGLGFTEKAYEHLHKLLPAVLTAIKACPCAEGCPCCTGKPLRGELVWNPERGEAAIPNKAAAIMILEGLLGDGSNLEAADTMALTDSTEAERLRLDADLRRRLERMREPQVVHPIQPRVETAPAQVEQTETLPEPDVARRGDRRRDFGRELRKRIVQRLEAEPLPPNLPPPGMKTGAGVLPPTAFPGKPVSPVELGDSLAARARRLKKERGE